MTSRRLRDGVLWLNGRTHTAGSDGNWENTAKHLVGSPAVPGASAVFVDNSGDGYWAPDGTAATGLSVVHHAAIDPGTGGWSCTVRAQVSSGADSGAWLVNKRSGGVTGFGIQRATTTSTVNAIVAEGSTQVTLTGADVGYDTDFTAGITWDHANTTARMYINGALTDTDATLTAPPAFVSHNLWFGRASVSDSAQWSGRIYSYHSDVELYTDAEMLQIHNDMTTPPAEVTIGRTYFRQRGPIEESLEWHGDGLGFDITVYPGTESEARAQRQQLLGLQRGDVIPVTNSSDSDMDGFYEVRDPVRVTPVEVYLSNWRFTASLRFEKVANGWAYPLTEATMIAATRTGVVSVPTTSRGTYAIPGSATDRRGTASFQNWRGINSALVLDVGQDFTVTATALAVTDGYTVPAAGVYDAGCTLEIKMADGNWYPIEQRQLPSAPNIHDELRLSTGVMRLYFGEVGVEVPAGAVQLEVLSDQGWELSPETHVLYTGGGVGSLIPRSVMVTENTPAVVSVVVQVSDWDAGVDAQITDSVTYTARRGQHYIDVTWTGITSSTIRLEGSGASAATAVGAYGLRATSDDTNGNRWIMASHDYTSVTAGTVRIEKTTATSFSAMVGMELDGSTATTDNAALNVAGEWWVAFGEHHTVVNQ